MKLILPVVSLLSWRRTQNQTEIVKHMSGMFQVAGLISTGFWRCEQDAVLASFDDTICRLEDRLSQTSRDVYTTLQSSVSVGGQGRSGVALLQSQGSDSGLLAFGLARQMVESGR